MPHLAVLRICVYEDNGKFIGHRILPIDGLSPGKMLVMLVRAYGLTRLMLKCRTIDNSPFIGKALFILDPERS